MLFFKKKNQSPIEKPAPINAEISSLFLDMGEQPHLLIAGATGSGKSVVVNGIVHSLLYRSPNDTEGGAQLILIDPKRVELVAYKDCPHTVCYASEPKTMLSALNLAMDITEERYSAMQERRIKKYNGADLYVIIDEFADLMTTQRKTVQPLVQRLAQIGRAARLHLVVCTQTPISKVIPTEIKCNFDSRVGLRARSEQDSRNIIGYTGLEDLPRYGQGVYMKPEGDELYNIPMVPNEEIDTIIRYWEDVARYLKSRR